MADFAEGFEMQEELEQIRSHGSLAAGLSELLFFAVSVSTRAVEERIPTHKHSSNQRWRSLRLRMPTFREWLQIPLTF